jgi:hypothetical protein
VIGLLRLWLMLLLRAPVNLSQHADQHRPERPVPSQSISSSYKAAVSWARLAWSPGERV